MKKGPVGFSSLVVLCLAWLFTNAMAGEGDNWRQSHPQWLWCDDFESSDTNLSNRYEDVSNNGMSVSGYDAFDGSKSLRQQYTQGQVDAGWVCKVDNQGFPDHIFMRWYHKFESGFSGFPPKMARIRHRDRTTWVSTYGVHCWLENDGVCALDVVAPKSSQANSVGWLPIARSGFSFANGKNIGRWICFEMEVQLNTPGKADGAYRLWAEDTLLAERTGVDLRGNTSEKINEVMLDCYWNGGSPRPQNRYYDNFVISTEKIGPYTGSNAVNKEKRNPAVIRYLTTPAVKMIQLKSSAASELLIRKSPDNSPRPAQEALYNLLGKKTITLDSR